MTNNTINTTAVLDAVEAARTANYEMRSVSHETIIEANAILCLIRRMVQCGHTEAAYIAADDLRHNAAVGTASSTVLTDKFVQATFNLINALDGWTE